jgi:uncharacterized protein DUF1592/uncharacterized protein DUF1588/uncharacterized protein DUF1595/uncharacterized protein DUF1585/uncharacterized protein DUF1587
MHRSCLFAITLVIAACGKDAPGEPPSIADRFPRLSHAQWEATVQDLFHLPAPAGLSATFQPDPQLGRFDNNIARLGMSAGLWRDYQRAAETLAERVVTDSTLYTQLVPDPSAVDPREFVASFGLRAFRRPLKDAEVDRYAQLFTDAPAVFPQNDATSAGVRMVVQAMLQSPFFLYRSELSTVVKGGGIPLDGYEIASRMSYLFWNTMPDDELFAAAKAGKLDSADGVTAQAQRVLDDPRTAAQFRRFHFQAYSIAEYGDLDKDKTAFPNWRKDVGVMMEEETLRFLDGVVSNNGGVADLLLSNKAYVNADLAKIYGLTGTFGDDFREVELDPATRAGLLTRAGFLARNATLTDPDPIHRGVFINRQIICREIHAPPAIPPVLDKHGNTNREKIDSVTGVGTCGEACHHVIINPIGFAFEEYDAVGALRTTDNGFPIDSADSYTFLSGNTITYANAVELSQALAASPEVHNCYATNLLEFMLGRDLTPIDTAVVGKMTDRSLKEQMSIKQLVMSVVTSSTFRMRNTTLEAQP